MKFLDKTGLSLVWNKITEKLNLKVDKVDGKQLSTEDYTTAEKTKLAGIAEGANKTVIDSELSATSTNPVQNKVVDSSIAIKKYPASVNGYYYALMDSDKSPNTVVENAQLMASVALGCQNTIGSYGEFVAGRKNSVTGAFASALGQSNTVSGNFAMATGVKNVVTKYASFASGAHNTASGSASTVFGNINIASGTASVAGGTFCSAIGTGSATSVGNWTANLYITGDAGATTYTYTMDNDDPYEQYYLFVGNKVSTSVDNEPYTALITAVDTTNKTITFDNTLNSSVAPSGQACYVNATVAKGDYTFAARGIAVGLSSWTVNRGGLAIGDHSFVGGNYNIANNINELAFGCYNKSNTGTKASRFTLGGGTSDTDRKNLFEVTTDGSIYASGLGSYDGTNPTESKSVQEVIKETRNITQITWSELRILRDNSNLIPGHFYRIIDYVTTTSQDETQSAGHQFDIIVRADDVNVLNEEASAIQHEGDTYFASSKLEAWKLNYCLDNDTDRFTWAANSETLLLTEYEDLWYSLKGTTDIDGTTYYLWKDNKDYADTTGEAGDTPGTFQTLGYLLTTDEIPTVGSYCHAIDMDRNLIAISNITTVKKLRKPTSSSNGTGVIYRMIDEYNNDYPYDFKNIQYKRYKCTSDTKSVFTNTYIGCISGSTMYPNDTSRFTFDKTAFQWCYTFNNSSTTTYTDASLSGSDYNNKMPQVTSLPNCVMGTGCYGTTTGNKCYSWTTGNSCSSWTIGNNCYSWTTGNNCSSWTTGNSCSSWTTGNNCSSWTTGNNCYSWTTGNYCSSWTTGNSCSSWTTGNSCYYWTTGNNCSSWTTGNSCSSWTTGNSCSSWTTGNSCSSWTTGNSCSSWTTGNNCSSWTTGNSCSSWTTGNSCSSWTTGNYCSSWTTGNWSGSKAVPQSYVQYFHLASGIQHVAISTDGTVSNSAPFKNFVVKSGVIGTYSSKLSIVVDSTKFPNNSNYEWIIAKNSSGEIKQYCEADLIQ